MWPTRLSRATFMEVDGEPEVRERVAPVHVPVGAVPPALLERFPPPPPPRRHGSTHVGVVHPVEHLCEVHIALRLERLVVQEGELWLREAEGQLRRCIPSSQRVDTMRGFHDTPEGGHAGISKMYAALRTSVFWPRMGESVGRFVKPGTAIPVSA